MMSRVFVLCIAFLCLCRTLAKAQEYDVPTFTILQQSDNYDLNASIVYFEDENWVDFEVIIEKEDYSLKPITGDLHLDPNNIYWITTKILLKSESGASINNWYLSVGECDYFDVLLYDAQQQLVLSESGGSMLPESKKTLKYGNKKSRVELTINPGEEYQLFIKYSRINNQPIRPNVRLSKYDYFQSWEYVEFTRRDWFFLGFIFTMFIFNLMYFFLTRGRSFLYHGLFILGVIVFTLDFFGITLDLPIIREHPTFLQLVNYLALALIDISYFQFIRHFLDLENNDKFWDKWFRRIIQLKIVFYLFIISFHYITYNEPLADSILAIFLASGFLFTIIFISFLYQKKEVRRQLVLAGTVIIFLAIGFNAISIIQGKGLWTLFTEAGIGLEIILFSFALAYRMKVLREEEQKAKIIREIDALKNKFFTNISHEFRTPLTIINGVTEIGKEKIKSLDTAGLYQSMTKIKNQSDKLLNLVNQVLGLTKLETKSMKLSTRRIPLIQWLEMVVSEFDEYATQKDIDLRFHSDVPTCDVEVDDRQLKTVVTNFISNALKFTEPGGVIEVGCQQNIKDQSEGIVISIKDSGIGIQESDLPRIFDRYYQADDERAVAHSGMGVGLSMSKEIVELMGGSIKADSKLNEGTSFSIWLPLKILSPGAYEIQEQKLVEGETVSHIVTNLPEEEKPIILIIDDHPEMVELLSDMLHDQFSLITAYQGEEGLQKALEHIPDIIIADVMMPVMDGLELCEKLKSNVRTDHIPVILLTAKTENQDRIKGYQKGADVYVTKPFEKQELLIIINNLYSLRKTLQEKYSHFNFIEDKEKIKKDDSFIHQVHQIMEENLSDFDLSVEELAKKLFMSRMQLHRKIKAISDKSASHYIRSYRLHKSRLLLKDLKASISDVAYDVGFQSPNYFSRSFHQEFGITPSDFRTSLSS